jgi:asparagine synthase (glutamine-hydrolysing)
MTVKYDDKEFTIVYNGELYNTDEIKAELNLLGHKFYTNSDTEVIIRSFVEWKEFCVEKFNGIFAFAIWDSYNHSLFFARDRMGVKPLFYSIKNESFIFASELKALLAHKYIEPIIDESSIAEIMFIGPGRTPGFGVFKDIQEVKPACCGYYTKTGIKIKKYWTLKAQEHNDSFDQTVDKVRFLVTDAIQRQLVSDVEVGTFLSGGLDSSIISSVANNEFKKSGKILKTFSVTYENNEKYFKNSKFQKEKNYSLCCHFHAERSTSSIGVSALHPSSAFALAGSAQYCSTSPGRLSAIL